MNVNTGIEHPQSVSAVISEMGWTLLLRFAIFVGLIPAALFISAGTLNWTMAWLYVGMNIAFLVISRIIMLVSNPDLLVERVQYREGEGVKGWDKRIVPVVAVYGPLAMWIIAGLDWRFGWSVEIPLSLQFSALAIAILGYAFATWAVLVNKFFSSVVRIQTDRGHTVVTTGPYRWVRHPGYAGGIVADLATPVVLGSVWAFIPAGLTVLLLIVRTVLEDRTLQAELDGYKAYTQQTHYRLMPGVW